MDIVKYNQKFITNGQGFVNLGATCYFNSLLQCLLSCPSIFQVLKENKHKPHIIKNPIAQKLIDLHETAINNISINNKVVPIWRDILTVSQSRNDRIRFNTGQQDAHEGLMLFLDVMDTIPEIKRLFEHRYNIKIMCNECKKWVVDKFETNLTFDVQPDLKTDQHENFRDIDKYYNTSMLLNDFLIKQNGYVDENYICPNADCKKKGYKYKTTSLTMIPEILPVLIKKYMKKQVTPFPSQLEFLTKNATTKLVYKLVAQSEHAGTMNSGHYWAICERADGWKNLNDSSVSNGTPGPTANSYILFYHFIGEIST